MLRAINRPAVSYDLVGLASLGLVTVGREGESSLRLDCPEIPFLLSRKHATLQLQPNGKILLNDLGSTNGTYAARALQPLRKLVPDQRWELREGDTLSFGGPEVIVARGEHVPNPFIFRFYACCDDQATGTGLADLLLAARQAESRASNDLQADQLPQVDTIATAGPSSPSHQHQHITTAKPKSEHRQQLPPPCSPSNVMTSILAMHLSCPICQDWLVACHTLSCGHMFCGLCLATWLNQNQTCPSCRKAVAGVPVRCFQVDSTINDLLDQGVNVMSPATKSERRQKQDHWDNVQETVVPDWALSLHKRKQKAAEAAARHNRGYMAQAVVVGPSHRLSEHGAGPHNTDS